VLATTYECFILFSDVHAQTYSNCYLFGTEHVYTFDNQRIDFVTDCELTLSKTCPPIVVVNATFEISVINEAYGEVSRAKCVKVIYGLSYIIEMCYDGTAKVSDNTLWIYFY